jgi:hypothetical protein
LLLSLPANGYEVIFHEGFEDDQFPPEGWSLYGTRFCPGHDSYWCALCTVWGSEYSIWVESPEVVLESGEVYTVRFYEECVYYGWVTAWDRFYFDDGTYVEFGSRCVPAPWFKKEINVEVPATAESGSFAIYAQPEDMTSGVEMYLDDFSIVHTATRIEPTSLGALKAIYR